MVVSQII